MLTAAPHPSHACAHHVAPSCSKWQRHVDAWVRWVRQTALLTDPSDMAAIVARDLALRAALRDHEAAAGERFMGSDTATSLAASMAGPLQEGPPRTEPLSWRPASLDAGPDVDEVQEQLRAFGVAAQRCVAGLNGDEAADSASGLDVEVTVHVDLGGYMASKPSLSRRPDGRVLIGAHAFLEPEWREFDRPLAQAPTGVYTYAHERPLVPLPTASAQAAAGGTAGGTAGLLVPTLCLKLKRREAVLAALDGTPMDEAVAAAAQPDPRAAARVNRLACEWARADTCGRAALGDDAKDLKLELASDRELQDAPDGPFGNKGGLYIESRIQLEEGADGTVRVQSPTITTPLVGVPEPFLAGHYMKVLCPVGGVLGGVRTLD